MKSHDVTTEKNLVTSTFTYCTIYLVLVLIFACVDAILQLFGVAIQDIYPQQTFHIGPIHLVCSSNF